MCGLVCLLLCAPCAMAQEGPELLEPVGVQLNATPVRRGDLSMIETYPASVVPYVEEFFFEQEGVVDEMLVIPGQWVKAGDALITLDTESEKERLETVEREIEQLSTNGSYQDELDEIDLKMLEVELRRLMNAHPVDESAVMLKKLDMERKQLDMQKAAELRALEMDRLLAEKQLLETEMARNVLYAPFDGRVVFMTGEWQRGSYVGAFTPLLYLADDTRLFVEADYISNNRLSLAHTLTARIGGGSYALTPTPVDEKKYMAQILAGEKLRRQFHIDQPDEALAPGQYAVVCLETNYRENVLMIPRTTLYTADRTRYVYVMENGVRVRRDVKVGLNTPWDVEITEGLEEGELVYVSE